MRAAIQDIHHRHRQNLRVGAAEITEERNTAGSRGRVRGGERDAEERVGAELLFVRRSIELDQLASIFACRSHRSPSAPGAMISLTLRDRLQ